MLRGIFMPMMRNKKIKKQAGLTLIEVIVGIVALSIALSIITTLIVPAEQNSADQIHQVKAAELAHSLMDEIMSKAYDENSDMTGGVIRCGEPNAATNPCSSTLGPEEANIELYNDVDDYHGLTLADLHSATSPYNEVYQGFELLVTVTQDGAALSLANNLAKRIEIKVTTPLKSDIYFTVYKTNF